MKRRMSDHEMFSCHSPLDRHDMNIVCVIKQKWLFVPSPNLDFDLRAPKKTWFGFQNIKTFSLIVFRDFILSICNISLQSCGFLLGPLYLHVITLILARFSNYINGKMWPKVMLPFPNFTDATVEVWEWISNFIPHFTGYVIIHPCWDWICVLVKGAPVRLYRYPSGLLPGHWGCLMITPMSW